jgi:DNA-binding transcriptional LysR family regulator
MNRLEDMQIYMETVRCGTFSAAARKLGLSKQYVSQRVAALEARLGVRLLNRTTRKIDPTPLGQEYYVRTLRLLQDADDADHAVSVHSLVPKGRLRMSAPMSYGLQHLPTLVSGFMARCPEVEVDIDLNDRIVDLISEGYDMALRIGVLPDSTLIARRLAPVRQFTVASPAWVAAHGMPQHPDELKQHNCLLYGHARPVDWYHRIDGQTRRMAVDGRMRANNGEILYQAALDGLGVTQLPGFIVAKAIQDGRLLALLPAFEPEAGAAHVVYPCHRQPNAVVRAFSDVLCAALGAGDGAQEPIQAF